MDTPNNGGFIKESLSRKAVVFGFHLLLGVQPNQLLEGLVDTLSSHWQIRLSYSNNFLVIEIRMTSVEKLQK